MSDNTPLPTEKQCSKCGEKKDVSEFSKCKHSTDGLQYRCKACDAQWYQDNREAKLQYQAQYCQDHRRELAQRYQDHREHDLARVAAWQRANPDKCRANNHRRRARKRGNGGTHTAADVKRQGDIQGWKCWWRGPGCAIDVKDNYHVDHLIPLAKGGHNGPSNLVISCPHCNDSKGAKTPDEFAGRLL